MNDLERFRILFRQYDIVYEGVHINRAISVDLWEFANHRMMFGLHTLLKNLFTYKDVSKIKAKHSILTTGGMSGRKDYLELYKAVISKIGNDVDINFGVEWGRKLCFNPRMIAKVTKESICLLKGTSLNVFERICVITDAIYYCNIILALQKCDFSAVKKYICLVDVLRVENVITQYMQTIGIKTFSLEEGIFYIFKGNIPHDAVHYETLTTDCLLCWSQYVIDEYLSHGIEKKRLLLAGYPKNVEIKKMRPLGDMRKCMILLARAGFDDANFRLLDILAKLADQYDFNLKLHPSCDFNRYRQYADMHRMNIVDEGVTINECLNQDTYDWAVAVNTTAYYEALMRGVPCLRFEDNSFQLPYGWKDTFSDKDSLLGVIQELRYLTTEQYQTEVDGMLKYVMGIGIDNYRELILS